MASSLAEKIKDTLYKKISLYELESDTYDADQKEYTVRTTDVHSAIGILIGKLTLLSDWNENAYDIFDRISTEERKPYDRLFYFVMENCNKDLMKALEESCSFINTYATGFFSDEQFLMNLLNWLNFGISMFVCLVLIPYLYRAQQNIVKIIMLFLSINKEVIKKKIEDYEDARDEIVANFSKIKKAFQQTNFNVERISIARPESKEEQKHNESLPEANPMSSSEISNEENAPLNDNTDMIKSAEILENKTKVNAILSER